MSGEVRHFSDGCTAGHAASVQPFHLGSLSRSDLRGAWSRAVASSSTPQAAEAVFIAEPHFPW